MVLALKSNGPLAANNAGKTSVGFPSFKHRRVRGDVYVLRAVLTEAGVNGLACPINARFANSDEHDGLLLAAVS